MKIITNSVPRDVIHAWELTKTERAEFDYLDWEAIEDGRDSADFVRYRGELYNLSDTDSGYSTMPPELKGWDAYVSDSFFSGVLFRYPREDYMGRSVEIDTDRVVCGRYFT